MFGYRWFALSKSVQWLEISLKLSRNNLAFHNFIRLTFNSTNCDLKIKKKRSFFEVYQNIEVSLPTAQHWTNIKYVSCDLRLNTHSNSFAIISWEGEKKNHNSNLNIIFHQNRHHIKQQMQMGEMPNKLLSAKSLLLFSSVLFSFSFSLSWFYACLSD